MTLGRVRHDALVVMGICAATLAVYARTVTFDYVNVDDPLYVVGNEVVERGLTLEGIAYAFTSTSEGNYLPLTWLSHMLAVELGGLDAAVHHGMNAALHALNAGLLYVFLRLSTGCTGRSAVVAALFALHPLRVESVAWIAERKDVLSGTFWMATLIAYWAYARRPSAARYFGVMAAFVLGLLSKSMLVTMPFVLLLLDVWPLNRVEPAERGAMTRIGRLAAEKAPMLLLSVAASAVALLGQKETGAMNANEVWSVPQRFVNAASAYGSYLVATFWPVDLAVYYPMPNDGAKWSGAIAGGAVLAVVSLACIALAIRRPYLPVGWFWFVGTLVPVIGIVQVGAQSHADRYTYIPHTGLLIAIVWGANELLRGARAAASLRASIAGAACVICAALTWIQVGYWRDSDTLFRHALDVTEDNWFAEESYGVALVHRLEFERAEPFLRAAIEHGPAGQRNHLNLGFTLFHLGRLDEAQTELVTALEIDPECSACWMMLGQTRMGLGEAFSAVQAYERGLRLDPQDVDARVDLGVAYGMLGQDARARAEFDRVLAGSPDNDTALYNYGVMELRLGNHAAGRAMIERSLEINADRADAWYSLAALDALQGRTDEAVAGLRRAIALNGSYADQWHTDPSFERLKAAGVRP